MRIIGTRLRLLDRSRFRLPWLAAAPGLGRSWSLGAYWGQADTAGIQTALFMEVNVAEANPGGETAWAAALPAPFAGVIVS